MPRAGGKRTEKPIFLKASPAFALDEHGCLLTGPLGRVNILRRDRVCATLWGDFRRKHVARPHRIRGFTRTPTAFPGPPTDFVLDLDRYHVNQRPGTAWPRSRPSYAAPSRLTGPMFF